MDLDTRIMKRGIPSLIDMWKDGYSSHLDKFHPYKALEQLKHIASLFSPGEFFYFVLNMKDLGLEYLHPSVTKFIDVDTENTSMEELLKCVVSEDLDSVQRKEMVLRDFLEKFSEPQELPFYKILYMYRLKDRYGKFRTMLLQVNVLSVSQKGTIEHVLSVHTDISYMGLAKSDHISFISLNGDKSFYNVETSTGEFDANLLVGPVDKIGNVLSKRELEVIHSYALGMQPKEIADLLNISENTVRTHRKNVLKKTGHSTMASLASQCVMEGLI